MKRLLSIMLALMLMLSMTATAFATEQTKDRTTTPEVYLTKTYNDPVGHAATFSFSIERPLEEGKSGPVLTIADISYTAAEKGGNKASQLNFASIATPGIYHYIVTEKQDGAIDLPHEKLIMSQAQYNVEVVVEKLANGTIAITSISVTQVTNPDNPDNNGKKVNADKPIDGGANGFNFVNTYAKEAGPDDPTLGSLKISKTVVNGLDATLEFPFTITLTYPAGGNPFNPAITHSGGDTVSLQVGRQTSFNLMNGENVVFTGLPVGTVVTVTELATNGFAPSATIIFDGSKTLQNAQVGQDLVIPEHALGSGENSVAVKNTRDAAPATGVILNVLPYVLMVAIAGGMIVLFTVMKRRKAQDNED